MKPLPAFSMRNLSSGACVPWPIPTFTAFPEPMYLVFGAIKKDGDGFLTAVASVRFLGVMVKRVIVTEDPSGLISYEDYK